MKQIIYSLAAVIFLASCGLGGGDNNAQVTDARVVDEPKGKEYPVNIETSTVTFTGSKLTGTHRGIFKLKEGYLMANTENITGGKFIIDIASMKNDDPDTNGSSKLITHLLSPDFFNVQEFPTAKFEITKSEKLLNDNVNTHKISGNLTLRDSTKNVTFNARVGIDEIGVSAFATFTIDRTLWGLFYGNDKSLGDKFIYPDVKIDMNLTPKK